jgi:hypothetical protein
MVNGVSRIRFGYTEVSVALKMKLVSVWIEEVWIFMEVLETDVKTLELTAAKVLATLTE